MVIDRITFVANIRKGLNKKSKEGEYTFLDTALAPLSGILRRSFARFPYQYQWTSTDGFTVQYANGKTKVNQLRFDFNPQTCDFKVILQRFKTALTDCRVTRIDYAKDYSQDLSTVRFCTEIPVKSITFLSRSGALETLYLGSADSSHRYRIYDKGLESGLPILKWRIESQIRFGKEETMECAEPFKSLVVQCPVLDGLKIQERAMALYLKENPEGFNELSSASRAKYKKILKGNPLRMTFLHPDTIYQKAKKELINYVYQIINLTSVTPLVYVPCN